MTTYYISDADGDDTDSGLSELLAWKTLGTISTQGVTSGDTILLKRGDTWAENLNTGDVIGGVTYGAYGTGALPQFQRFYVTGTPGTQDGITLENLHMIAPAGSAAISNTGAQNLHVRDCTIDGNDSNFQNILISGLTETTWIEGFIIEGCTILDAGTAPGEFGNVNLGSWVRNAIIRNNDISSAENDNVLVWNQSGLGVDVEHAPYNIQILSNTIHDSESFLGIDIGKDAHDILINGNSVYDNAGPGIFTDAGTYNITISNNTVWGNNAGIEPANSIGTTIINNTVYGDTNYCLWISGINTNLVVKNNIFVATGAQYYTIAVDQRSLAGTVMDNNCYFDVVGGDGVFWKTTVDATEYASLALWQDATGQDLNSIWADPQFIDTTDFHLGSNSPCIRAGAKDTGLVTRGTPDIGAIQYIGSPLWRLLRGRYLDVYRMRHN